MLKFNPSNLISFTPNSDHKLEGQFKISNPSNNCSAPFKVTLLSFKIKSTKPELFLVKPYVGVLLPLQ